MAKKHNVEQSHRGEPLEILVAVKNTDGTVVSNPNDQTITLTIGRTEKGKPVLSFSALPQVQLLNLAEGEWLISVPESDLEGLEEGKVYYYNIWSQETGDEPRLQAYGRLTRKGSIRD